MTKERNQWSLNASTQARTRRKQVRSSKAAPSVALIVTQETNGWSVRWCQRTWPDPPPILKALLSFCWLCRNKVELQWKKMSSIHSDGLNSFSTNSSEFRRRPRPVCPLSFFESAALQSHGQQETQRPGRWGGTCPSLSLKLSWPEQKTKSEKLINLAALCLLFVV